jgi:hypothetical protein
MFKIEMLNVDWNDRSHPTVVHSILSQVSRLMSILREEWAKTASKVHGWHICETER